MKKIKKIRLAARRKFLQDSLKVGVLASGLTTVLPSPAKSQTRNCEVSPPKDVYDFIVVGSGPGGAPVAANLAKAGKRVLVLEAGVDVRNANTLIPAFHPFSTEDERLSWKFYVKHYSDIVQRARDKEKYDAKHDGVLYPRAAALGGCSVHNAMITMYPDNSDWENLQKTTGNQMFDPINMRKYFQRLEHNHYLLRGWDQRAVVSRNGFEGWLGTEMSPITKLFSDPKFLEIGSSAALEIGMWKEFQNQVLRFMGLADLDPNSWNHVVNKSEGIFQIPKSTLNGIRSSARDLLIDAQKKYPDYLTIQTASLVTRVLIKQEGINTKAYGVAYVKGEGLYKADARADQNGTVASCAEKEVYASEVILSGGAFNSPQLLMLSGIGDPEHLADMGIAKAVGLPGVGLNLQDRYEVGVVVKMDTPFSSLNKCTFGVAGDPCMKGYVDGTDDTYTSNGLILGIKNRSSANKADPDLFIFSSPGDFHGYKDGWSKESYKMNHYTWAVLKGHTQNTAGTVRLRSKNPLDTPDINFRYFDDGKSLTGDDMKSVMQGLKFARRINERVRGSLWKTEIYPGEAIKSENDTQLAEYIRDNAWGHHASCTNKMGANGLTTDNSANAVVDADFKVIGVSGLRVVDASVFERIPGLFLALPIYMISEMASDVILGKKQKL